MSAQNFKLDQPHFTKPRSLLRNFSGMILGLALLGWPTSLISKETLSREARQELIRGLIREVAVTKVALPRGKHGVAVSADGKVDQAKAESELRANGAAIRPGMPV